MSETSKPPDGDGEEKPPQSEELKRFLEMLGPSAQAVQITPDSAMIMQKEMDFSQTLHHIILYTLYTEHYLRTKELPKDDASDAEKHQLVMHQLSLSAMALVITKHINEMLVTRGYPDDGNTNKAAHMMALAGFLAPSFGKVGMEVLQELQTDKAVQRKFKEDAMELGKELAAKVMSKQAEPEEDPAIPPPPGQRLISFDRAKLASLKAAYADATKADLLSFVFDGSEWDTGYAKYAIEYLESEMAKKGM